MSNVIQFPRNRELAMRLYKQASDVDDASPRDGILLYEKALRIDPDFALAWTNLGNCHFKLGNPEMAEECFEKAIEIDPGQPEALYNLGYLKFEARAYLTSTEYFEKAIANDPTFADAHFNLAMAFEMCGRPTHAKPHWKEYLRLQSDGPWATIAQAHLTQYSYNAILTSR